MAVMLYKPGESQKVEPQYLEGELANGWSLDEAVMTGEDKALEYTDEDLEAARDLYKEKFGKAPHHRMKIESIMEEVNGDSKPE